MKKVAMKGDLHSKALALAAIVGCLQCSVVAAFLVRGPDTLPATATASKPAITGAKDAEILAKETHGSWTLAPSSSGSATSTTLGSSRYVDELTRGRRGSRYDGDVNTWARTEEERRLVRLGQAYVDLTLTFSWILTSPLRSISFQYLRVTWSGRWNDDWTRSRS